MLCATVSTAANYISLLSSPEWYLLATARSHYFMQVLNIMHRAKPVLTKIPRGTAIHSKKGYTHVTVML